MPIFTYPPIGNCHYREVFLLAVGVQSEHKIGMINKS